LADLCRGLCSVCCACDVLGINPPSQENSQLAGHKAASELLVQHFTGRHGVFSALLFWIPEARRSAWLANQPRDRRRGSRVDWWNSWDDRPASQETRILGICPTPFVDTPTERRRRWKIPGRRTRRALVARAKLRRRRNRRRRAVYDSLLQNAHPRFERRNPTGRFAALLDVGRFPAETKTSRRG
jgi:hypothetical protein